MKKLTFFLALMLVSLFGAQTIKAEVAIFRSFSSDGKTLTIYYDEQRNEGDLELWPNMALLSSDVKKNVTKAIFEESVKNAQPQSTYSWFYNYQQLTEIEHLDYLNTSEVTNMESMFELCKALTSLDLSHFNTSKVTNMQSMFRICKTLTSLDLTGFDVRQVTNMSEMFRGCSNLTTIYCNEDWSGIPTYSDDMFLDCNKLVGGEGTSYLVLNGNYACPDNRANGKPGYFTRTICSAPTNLAVSDVTDESATISWTPGASDQTKWYITYKSKSQSGFFIGGEVSTPSCTLQGLSPETEYEVKVKAICSADLESEYSESIFFTTAPEATCKVPTHLRATNVSYNEATITWARGSSDQTKWYITFKTKSQGGFFTGGEETTTSSTLINLQPETEYEVKVKAICSSSDESEYTESIFFTTPQKPVANAQVYTVLNGTVLTYYYDNKYEEYQDAGYPVKMKPGSNGCVSNDYRDQVKTINIDPSMQNYTPTIMSRFFSASNPYAMEALTAINGLQYLNTSKVKYMDYMFYKCEALETIDLSSLNTSNVEDMNNMFYGCKKLATITGIETLNTSKVTDMHDMFCACKKLEKLDLHQWDVSSVTNMESMFSTCENLKELDLTGFDVSNVENMYAMFYNSKQLATIYCEDNWNTTATALTNSKYMFETCNALQGDNGTKWAAGNPKDITYARPDGGTEAPGYFSKKEVTGMEEVSHQPSAVSCQKVLRDGQLYLMYEGRMYDVRGQKVK